jgi:hypothetical protein
MTEFAEAPSDSEFQWLKELQDADGKREDPAQFLLMVIAG